MDYTIKIIKQEKVGSIYRINFITSIDNYSKDYTIDTTIADEDKVKIAITNFIDLNIAMPATAVPKEFSPLRPEPVVETPVVKTQAELDKEAKQNEIDSISNQIKDLILGLKEDSEVLEIAILSNNESKIVSKKTKVSDKFTKYNELYNLLQTKKEELKLL